MTEDYQSETKEEEWEQFTDCAEGSTPQGHLMSIQQEMRRVERKMKEVDGDIEAWKAYLHKFESYHNRLCRERGPRVLQSSISDILDEKLEEVESMIGWARETVHRLETQPALLRERLDALTECCGIFQTFKAEEDDGWSEEEVSVAG